MTDIREKIAKIVGDAMVDYAASVYNEYHDPLSTRVYADRILALLGDAAKKSREGE